MAKPPLLAKPSPEEVLYLYLVVFDKSLNVVLVKEEEKVQNHINYIRKVLHGEELNYFKIKKFTLAMITVSRKLRPYFQAQTI